MSSGPFLPIPPARSFVISARSAQRLAIIGMEMSCPSLGNLFLDPLSLSEHVLSIPNNVTLLSQRDMATGFSVLCCLSSLKHTNPACLVAGPSAPCAPVLWMHSRNARTACITLFAHVTLVRSTLGL